MKTKLTVILFMIAVSFFAKAETSYRRDSAVCNFRGDEVSLDIRGSEAFENPADNDYGEHIILTHKGVSHKVEQTEGRYKMIVGPNDLCSKALAMETQKNEIAFFLQRDQRPLPDKLLILYFSTKTHSSELVATRISVKAASFASGKPYFKLASDPENEKSGKVKIKDQDYHYTEKVLEPWIYFDGINFKFDVDMTYQNFEENNLIGKNILSGLKEYQETHYRVARSPTSHEKCISIARGDWKCASP